MEDEKYKLWLENELARIEQKLDAFDARDDERFQALLAYSSITKDFSERLFKLEEEHFGKPHIGSNAIDKLVREVKLLNEIIRPSTKTVPAGVYKDAPQKDINISRAIEDLRDELNTTKKNLQNMVMTYGKH